MPDPLLFVAPAGAVFVCAVWLHYLASIPKEKVPENPRGHSAGMVLGAGASLAGAAVSAGPLGAISATIAVVLSAFWFYLLRQAPLPDGDLAVGLGDPFPSFEALDQSGQPFKSTQLTGKRLLFKFFRGHW